MNNKLHQKLNRKLNRKLNKKLNRKASGNLTMMIIGLLGFIAIISLSIYANNELVASIPPHTQNDSEKYGSSLSNLSSSDDIETQILDPLSPDNSILKTAYNTAVAIGTTAVIGVSAIFTLLVLPSLLQSLFNQIASTLDLGQSGVVLLWFFTSAASIYIVAKVIQAVRGTTEPA